MCICVYFGLILNHNHSADGNNDRGTSSSSATLWIIDFVGTTMELCDTEN